MKCYFNKICQGSLFTIAMLLGSVSTSAVILIIKHGSKANKLSDDASKHAIHRTIAQNITFRLSKEIKKIENSKGSSSQPFISSFVNNGPPTVVVGSRQETVTDPSALNITIVQKDDRVNNIDDSDNFRGKATSRERSHRTQIGYNTNIIDKAIPISSPSVGGYALQVKNVYLDSTDATGKTAKYVLLVKSYACNNGDRASGSCSSSSIMGEYSVIIFANRTCPVIGGTQLIVANDPGKDFYNLNCTCPPGKTIQANGTCILRCPAGQEIRSGSCANCAAGTYSTDGSNTCIPCSGCSGSDCDPTQGCTSCPAGRQLSGNSCTPCNDGTWASAGRNVCDSCLSVGRTACSATTGVATSCSSGYGLSSGNCSLCAGGTYSSGGANSCSPCAAGTYSSAGASSCSPCAAGTYSPSGASSCTPCSAGRYSSSGAGSCSSCAAGTYSSASASSCTSCSANTWASSGASSCQSCITTGVASCDSTTGAPISCSSGYQKSTTGDRCVLNCPNGSIIGGSGDSTSVSGCNCDGSTPAWTGAPLNMCHTRCSTGYIYCQGASYPTTYNDYYYFTGCINTCNVQGSTLLNCYFTARGKTFYISPSSCDNSSVPFVCPANSAVGNSGNPVYDYWNCDANNPGDPACMYFGTPIGDNCFCPDSGYSDYRMLLWDYSATYGNWGCYNQSGLTG